MLNHLSDAAGAMMDLLAAALGVERPKPAGDIPMPEWLGHYIEPETGLSARIDRAGPGQVRLRFGHAAERVDLQPDGSAGTVRTRLHAGDGGLWMDRPQENQTSRLVPCDGPPGMDMAGRYRCAELDAEVTVVDAGGALYGGFSGFLGQGRMELLDPVGPDLWTLPCPRAGPHAARRLDAGLPPRQRRPRRWRRGRLLAGAAAGLCAG